MQNTLYDVDVWLPFNGGQYHCTIAQKITETQKREYEEAYEEELEAWRCAPPAWSLPFFHSLKFVKHNPKRKVEMGSYLLKNFKLGDKIFANVTGKEHWYQSQVVEATVVDIKSTPFKLICKAEGEFMLYNKVNNWKEEKVNCITFELKEEHFTNEFPTAGRKLEEVKPHYKNKRIEYIAYETANSKL